MHIYGFGLFSDLSLEKNNNKKNIKENRIKTKNKKEIKILTKQKLGLIKNLNKIWKLELKIKIKLKRAEGPNWNKNEVF